MVVAQDQLTEKLWQSNTCKDLNINQQVVIECFETPAEFEIKSYQFNLGN